MRELRPVAEGIQRPAYTPPESRGQHMNRTVTWTAAKDGIGHATVGRSFNALCGRRATLVRLAWPITERCALCAERLVAAAA
jgi:hypothetical protein